MRILFLLLFFLPTLITHASERHAPPPFQTSTGRAVFVDFQKANYTIEYDIDGKEVRVVADIEFNMPEPGMPIFDSIANPTSVAINGESASQTLISTPNRETQVRVVQSTLPAGNHRMRIEVPMDQEYLGVNNIDFGAGTVKNQFHMSDGEDRGFLELFLPSNLEYDQVPMNFNVRLKGATSHHRIYTNGRSRRISENEFSIQFPEGFTSSSPFFHLVNSDQVREITFEYRSKNGRLIPIVAYQEKSYPNGTIIDEAEAQRVLKEAMKIAISTMEELENNFGSYPHDSFIMNVEGPNGSGMEYCGAATAGLLAVRHELIHSYFGRGYLPANGNAGWIDEALTRWAENGYKSRTTFSAADARALAAQPLYTRHHHDRGYIEGENFIEYLHGTLSTRGGLVPFLRHLVESRKLKTLSTEEFIGEMNQFYGADFTSEFSSVYVGDTGTHDHQ